ASRRPRGSFRRLEVEALETRIVPTICYWSGNATAAGDPSWSNPGNWYFGVVPTNNDDVVFNDAGHLVPDANLNMHNGTEALHVPNHAIAPFNSVNDLGPLILNTFTIGRNDFHFAGNGITLKQQLLCSSTFTSGVSWIGGGGFNGGGFFVPSMDLSLLG